MDPWEKDDMLAWDAILVIGVGWAPVHPEVVDKAPPST